VRARAPATLTLHEILRSGFDVSYVIRECDRQPILPGPGETDIQLLIILL
jgi:hypothetical protein